MSSPYAQLFAKDNYARKAVCARDPLIFRFPGNIYVIATQVQRIADQISSMFAGLDCFAKSV